MYLVPRPTFSQDTEALENCDEAWIRRVEFKTITPLSCVTLLRVAFAFWLIIVCPGESTDRNSICASCPMYSSHLQARIGDSLMMHVNVIISPSYTMSLCLLASELYSVISDAEEEPKVYHKVWLISTY